MRVLVCVLSAWLLVVAGCGGQRVEVVDPATAIQLSGRWNDEDSKLVSSTCIDEFLRKPWVNEFRDRTARKPVVRVSLIENKSNEEIATQIFTDDLIRAFIDSGRVRAVASRSEAEVQRNERGDIQANSTAQTAPRSGQELAPDFLLQGAIRIQHDDHGDTQVKFYQVDLKLIDATTNEMVATSSTERKKVVEK